MRTTIIVILTSLVLSACHKAPSPQTTEPDHASRCKALQMKMNQAMVQNSDVNQAVNAAESANYQQAYKNECA